jgi:hypothetical protein
MLRITGVLFLFCFLLPVAMGKPSLTVSQSYYTLTPEGCRFDMLVKLPDGLNAKASQASASFTVRQRNWSHDREHTASSSLIYRAPLKGATASFSFADMYDCDLFGDSFTLTVWLDQEELSSSDFYLSRPDCNDGDCSDRGSEVIWYKEEQAARSLESQNKYEEEVDKKNEELEAAAERFAARFKGEIPLRHPTLLGLKTADTLGTYGIRYEPIGFFTVGVAERVDLGLGVRSFRVGEEKLIFPGAEVKIKLVNESKYTPAISLSASGNTLMRDRQIPQGSGGLRLGASALGSFSEDAQNIGDTQFTAGLHASRLLQSGANKSFNARLHMGVLFTQTSAAKGTELGAQSYTGEDLILQFGADFTEWHNVLALLAEGSYSVARDRTELSAGFRATLGGLSTDLGVGFTGAESVVVDGAAIDLPARFFPRLGFSFLF